jgi:hypothetical protein
MCDDPQLRRTLGQSPVEIGTMDVPFFLVLLLVMHSYIYRPKSEETYQYGDPYSVSEGVFRGHSTSLVPSFQRIIRKSTGSVQYGLIYFSIPSFRSTRDEFGDTWIPGHQSSMSIIFLLISFFFF